MKGYSIHPDIVEVGNKIASDLIDASLSFSLTSMGGVVPYPTWLEKNKDNPYIIFILAYINKEIDSVTAIYLAMDQKRKEIEE